MSLPLPHPPARWSVAGVIVFVFSCLIPTVDADAVELAITVEDVAAAPGQLNVPIRVYLDNYSDTVAGFAILLKLNRPDICQFVPDSLLVIDTAGSLISGWELVAARSLGGSYYDIKITAFSDLLFDPAFTPGISPQQGGLLFTLTANAWSIPDTMQGRTAEILIETLFLDHFSFSDPNGQSIGISCTTTVTLDTVCFVDTSKVHISNGSFTIFDPNCVPITAGDMNGDGFVTVSDTIAFADFVVNGTVPSAPYNADLNGDGCVNWLDWEIFQSGGDVAACTIFDPPWCCCVGIRGNVNYDLMESGGDNIDISDLTYLVAFMFGGGPAPPCVDEADVNANLQQDIEDLTYLVAFMFGGGPAPAGCQ